MIGSRLVRALLATVAVALAGGTTLAAPAGAAPAKAVRGTQDTPAAAGDAAIGDLAACIQGSKRLAVVFLIDESKSLQITDPDGTRVDAARAALDSLASLAGERGAGRTRVDVTMAAFAASYRPVRGWTAVTPANTARLNRAIASFGALDDGTDTDFVNALSGARKALADRSAAITARDGDEPCKAILFFTDGEYDITVRDAKSAARLGRTKPYAPGVTLNDAAGVAAAEAAGREALCREGGLADGIRGDDITVLTVALASQLEGNAQDLLAATTVGESGGETCGRRTDTPPGSYLAAEDVDLLIARFDEVAARVAGGTLLPTAPVEVCGAQVCPEGTREAKLDQSVRRLRIFALAPRPGLAVVLDGPAGSGRIDGPGTTKIGDIEVRATSVAGRGLTLELDRPSELAQWTGTWSVQLVDATEKLKGQPATLQLYVYSDLGITLTKRPALTRGVAAKVSASLATPKGIDPEGLVSEAKATMRFDDPLRGTSKTVELAGTGAGPYTGTFTPPANYRTNSYDVSIELRATTRDGAAVVVRSTPTDVLVRRPEGSIQFVPASVALPTITGSGTAASTLILIGGTSDGCVWFGPATASAPADAGRLAVTYDGQAAASEASCLAVKAGSSRTISVEVSPEGRATGAVRGILQAHEKVKGGTATVTDVPYRLDLARGIDETRRALLAVGLLVAGLAAPMLLLVGINSLTARFQALDAVQGAVLPVRVQGDRISLMTDGRSRPFRLVARDFRSLTGTGNARRFTFGGIEFRAKASRNPFGATAALAAPEGGAEKLKGRAGSKVALDPGLSGSWIFLLDPTRTRRAGGDVAEGNVIAFLAEGDTNAQIDRLLPDITERLPDTAADLAGLVRSRKARKPKRAKGRAEVAAAEADADAADPDAADPDAEADERIDAAGAEGAEPDAVDPDPPPPSAPSGFTGPTGFTGGPG